KDLVPATDDGTFNLQIDGSTDATGGDGTDTGPVSVSPYSNHGVGETGEGTDLAKYDSSTVCVKNGDTENPLSDSSDFAVDSKDSVVCTITNTRKQGTLQVVKVVNAAGDATSDDGMFQLRIDGQNAGSPVGYPGGDSGDPTSVSPYTSHVIGEIPGDSSTRLNQYTSTTECTKNGEAYLANEAGIRRDSIDVGSNDHVICTITNTRKQGTVEVIKDLVPATDGGSFNLQVDGS